MNLAAKIILIAVLILAAVSCSGSQEAGQTVNEAYYGQSQKSPLKLVETPSFLGNPKPVPVIYPPEIFGVYVPSHVSLERDMLIGEHWIFFKLKDALWFVEKIEEDLDCVAEADDNEKDSAIKMLSEPLKTIVVPYSK